MDIQQAIDTFLATRAPATRNLAELALKYFREWYLQTTGTPLSLTNWTVQDTREYVSYLLHVRKLKPGSINSYLSQLKAFCNWCMDENDPPLLLRNPTKGVKGVQVQKKAVVVPDRNEENQLLRVLAQEPPQYRFIILFAMHTGLRIAELAALKLDDIELGDKHQTLRDFLSHVPDAKAFRSGMLHVRAGKGMKARDVDLNATAREVLLEYLKVRPNEGYDELIISTKLRRPVKIAGVRYACKRYQKLISFHLHPHLLRRMFATKIARSNDIEVAAELLGHANINTTRRYVHVDAGKRRQAVESIEE